MLYAVYAKQYIITYHGNGPNEEIAGVPPQQTKLHGVDCYISEQKPTRTNYDFRGWATDEDLTLPKYAPGTICQENIDLDLYAVWEEKEIQVIFILEIKQRGTEK